MASLTRRVTLSPSPGYCVKTKIQSSGIKVFLNIAWDALVPPPPTGTTPEAIEDPNYIMPIVVGDIRDDTDKKGVSCKVVDCVYSKELKSKALRETDFKQFLSLIALERVEEKHEIQLSRTLASPNIPSKGKLESRSVVVPVYGHPPLTEANPIKITSEQASSSPKKTLIEEIGNIPPINGQIDSSKLGAERPAWSLTRTKEGGIKVDLDMPRMTRQLAEVAELEVEPRRIIFSAGSPPLYSFDQEFQDASRDFQVESARAEWNVESKKLTIFL